MLSIWSSLKPNPRTRVSFRTVYKMNIWPPLIRLEFKADASASSPHTASSLSKCLSKNPDTDPPPTCPDDAPNCLVTTSWGRPKIKWKGLVRLLGALPRRYIGSWWLFLTVVMGALVYVLYVATRILVPSSCHLNPTMGETRHRGGDF